MHFFLILSFYNKREGGLYLPIHIFRRGWAGLVQVAVAAVGCVAADALTMIYERSREVAYLFFGYLTFNLRFHNIFRVFLFDVSPSLQDTPNMYVHSELRCLMHPRQGNTRHMGPYTWQALKLRPRVRHFSIVLPKKVICRVDDREQLSKYR